MILGDLSDRFDPSAAGRFGADFYMALVDAAPDALVVVDVNGTIRIANRQAETLFGYTREELVGRSVDMLVPDALRATHLKQREAYIALPHTRPMGARLSLTAVRQDGTGFPVDIALSSIRTGDDLLVCAAVRDITAPVETRRMLAEAQRAANFDLITGLPNRSSFLRMLGDQINESAGRSTTFAVLYADLDRFREINDAFGHEGGDAVLNEFGARIRQAGPRTAERVARLGVDDFAFLLPPGSGIDEARRAAEDGIRFLREPFTLSEQPVHLSASIGIAAFPAHGLSAEELLRHAEAAMFAAKQTQTRYAVYGAELDAHSQQKLAVLGDLRRALGTDELTLHYQPQVDFRTNLLVGAEALLRWRHPQRGIVPPLEFIPVAEETGLIHQLTPWVLKRALQQQRAWQRAGLDLRLAVNVSMRNLRDPDFLTVVDALVGTSGVDPATITLEVTEAAMMLEATRTLDVLTRIRAIGVNLSIDDFGTGYSSLAYLSRLPVNEVKIDRSFVMACAAPGPRAIVQAVIDLGNVFGLRVVAEGVKDQATWKEVRELGCHIAQGYHLSPPLAAPDFAIWAARQPSVSSASR